MRFEHFALNVTEPVAMTAWYQKHFNIQILSAMKESPFTQWWGDSEGRVFCEVYYNPKAKVIDFENQHPLEFHFAFAVDDPESLQNQLIEDSATFFEVVNLDDGSELIMMRDPWGIPLQLCKRGKPFLS